MGEREGEREGREIERERVGEREGGREIGRETHLFRQGELFDLVFEVDHQPRVATERNRVRGSWRESV